MDQRQPDTHICLTLVDKLGSDKCKEKTNLDQTNTNTREIGIIQIQDKLESEK